MRIRQNQNLLPLNTKSLSSPPKYKSLSILNLLSLFVTHCQRQPLRVRGWKRWKNTPILSKICSQGSNLSKQLINELSMSCLSGHKCLHHGTEWERRSNSRISSIINSRIHSSSRIQRNLLCSRLITRGRSNSKSFTSCSL